MGRRRVRGHGRATAACVAMAKDHINFRFEIKKRSNIMWVKTDDIEALRLLFEAMFRRTFYILIQDKNWFLVEIV